MSGPQEPADAVQIGVILGLQSGSFGLGQRSNIPSFTHMTCPVAAAITGTLLSTEAT